MTPIRSPGSAREDTRAGFALLMVLLFLLAVTAIIAPLVLGARTDFVVAANRLQQDRLESLASGLVTVLARELGAPAAEPRNEALTYRSAPLRCRDDRHVITARIQDQSGLIGLNSAPPELLSAGFQALEFPSGDVRELTEALVAYRTIPPSEQGGEPSDGQRPMQATDDEIVIGGLKKAPFEAVEELYDFKGFRGKPVRAVFEVFSTHNTTETIVGPRISTRLSRILPPSPSPSYPFIIPDIQEGAKVYRIDVEVRSTDAAMAGYAGAIVNASESETGEFGIIERTANPEFLPEGETDFSGAVDCAMIFGQGVAAELAAGPR